MKKKIVKIFLSICLVLGGCMVLYSLGCDAKSVDVASSADLHEATKEAVRKKDTGKDYMRCDKDINITADFTVMTSDDFFVDKPYSNLGYGRVLENMTLNGNNHTITIKGETKGSLGAFKNGLFGLIQNCEIKDLNVVYEVDLYLKGSSGDIFGGISRSLESSTMTNCKVSYNRKVQIDFWTHTNGWHNSGFGGLIGSVYDSTIDNCQVFGDLMGTAGYAGGLVDYLDSDATIKNCIFTGSLKTYYLEESFVGGLVGSADGTIISSKVNLKLMESTGEPQAWRSRTSYVGGLVGLLGGKLSDCYLEFQENGYFTYIHKTNGAFYTSVKAGVIAGKASKGSVVKNVYIDGYNDDICNLQFNDARSYALGIENDESTNISHVYFVDNAYYYDYQEEAEAVSKVQEGNDYVYQTTLHNEEVTIKVVMKYHEKDEVWKDDYIILTIGEEVFELHKEGELLGDNNKVYYYDIINDLSYSIEIPTFTSASSIIKFSKRLDPIHWRAATFVSSYHDIEFDTGGNVIGGSENYWKFDSQTGKPLLKNLD